MEYRFLCRTYFFLRVQQLALLYIETWFIDDGILLAFILPSHSSILSAEWSFPDTAQSYITKHFETHPSGYFVD
jgi:hypothetical protein